MVFCFSYINERERIHELESQFSKKYGDFNYFCKVMMITITFIPIISHRHTSLVFCLKYSNRKKALNYSCCHHSFSL